LTTNVIVFGATENDFYIRRLINSNLEKDLTIVVNVRQSILGHTPPTEYRDLNIEVLRSGVSVYKSGWHGAGSGTERKTYSIKV